jgi:hypothetical protein
VNGHALVPLVGIEGGFINSCWSISSSRADHLAHLKGRDSQCHLTDRRHAASEGQRRRPRTPEVHRPAHSR